MTAPADWLTGERPPLPRREQTPLYDQALAAAGVLLADREARESTAVLYRVEELDRVLEPTWPAVEPSEDGTVPALPRVARLGSWGWVRRNLNVKRLVAGGASGLVLAVTALAWWFA